ncbi:MAG TPA: hypothetical protein VGR89_10395 [Puia sp.]|nr:hypothetical protein [Puia sp.]
MGRERGELKRFRCHTGHAYTENELLAAQGREVEKTLWVALRALEEKKTLLEKIAHREDRQGITTLAAGHSKRADELKAHIGRIKHLIFSIQNAAEE